LSARTILIGVDSDKFTYPLIHDIFDWLALRYICCVFTIKVEFAQNRFMVSEDIFTLEFWYLCNLLIAAYYYFLFLIFIFRFRLYVFWLVNLKVIIVIVRIALLIYLCFLLLLVISQLGVLFFIFATYERVLKANSLKIWAKGSRLFTNLAVYVIFNAHKLAGICLISSPVSLIFLSILSIAFLNLFVDIDIFASFFLALNEARISSVLLISIFIISKIDGHSFQAAITYDNIAITLLTVFIILIWTEIFSVAILLLLLLLEGLLESWKRLLGQTYIWVESEPLRIEYRTHRTLWQFLDLVKILCFKSRNRFLLVLNDKGWLVKATICSSLTYKVCIIDILWWFTF